MTKDNKFTDSEQNPENMGAQKNAENESTESVEQDQSKNAEADEVNSEESSSKKKKKKMKFSRKDEKIAELEEKANSLNDKYLRLFSEFDNFRKRTARERLELSKTASADLVVSLLPVLDDFERGLGTLTADDELTKGAREGMELIFNKFKSILEKTGLKCMEANGKEFDTDFHEALTKIPAPSDDLKGKVVDVI